MTSRLAIPSMPTNKGEVHLRHLPHQADAASRPLWGVENKLKVVSNTTGCMGSCMKDNIGESQGSKRCIVPCMSACSVRPREHIKNAGVESVERVKGRNNNICRTVDNLAVFVIALSNIQGVAMMLELRTERVRVFTLEQ